MISHGNIWLYTHDIIPVYHDEVVRVVSQKSGPSRIAEAQHHQFHKNHGDHVEQPQRQMVSHDSQGFLEPIDFCNFCDFCEKVCFPIFLGLCYIVCQCMIYPSVNKHRYGISSPIVDHVLGETLICVGRDWPDYLAEEPR